MEENNNNLGKVKYVIQMGAAITGGAAGAALGLITANPLGVIALGALGAGIGKALEDVAERVYSNREKTRIGAAATFTINKIDEEIQSGKSFRQDEFFKQHDYYRSPADELFEGMLLAAKNEHEERKIKTISNVFSNSVFMPNISVGEVNHMLRIVQNLSYRQMCVLSLFHRKNLIEGLKLSETNFLDQEHLLEELSTDSISLRQEIYELYHMGLVNKFSSAKNPKDFIALLSWDSVVPNNMVLSDFGERCYELMGLYELPIGDIKEVAELLV